MAKKRLKWNYEACYKIAQGCEKIVDFKRKNQVAYNVARKEGWIKDYTWFMPTKEVRHLPRPNRRIWTFEKCYELAKECETLSEFEHKYHACACTSRKYGWTDSFTWLTKRDVSKKIVQQYDKDMNLIAIFDSIKEACDVTGLRRSGISNCCRGILKTSQGFIWKFSESI